MSDAYRSGRADGWRDYAQDGRRARDFAAGRGGEQRSFDEDGRRYGAPSYRDERDAAERYGAGRYGRPGYGADYGYTRSRGYGGGIVGDNDPVRRVADGDTERVFGQHRGRGPKSYTRSDERIGEDINERLTDDAWLDATEIEVVVAKGEVKLTGAVASRQDKRRAEDIAEDVSGVKQVQNNLRIQAPGAQAPATRTGLSA